MKYCFPIAKEKGLESKVFPHFGGAPMFLIVDDDDSSSVLVQAPEHQEHGRCRPVELLAGHDFEAMIVGGIGPGAIAKLMRMGKRVYLSGAPTVQANLDLLAQGALEECDDGANDGPRDPSRSLFFISSIIPTPISRDHRAGHALYHGYQERSRDTQLIRLQRCPRLI